MAHPEAQMQAIRNQALACDYKQNIGLLNKPMNEKETTTYFDDLINWILGNQPIQEILVFNINNLLTEIRFYARGNNFQHINGWG